MKDRRAPQIYITGASCAGVTTLGAALASRLGSQHIDVDAAYWLPSDPPYSTKRPVADRLALIRAAQAKGGWVLSGACESWGETLTAGAGLIVFLVTAHAVRMPRLLAREAARHGPRILPGGDMHAAHLAFAQWASNYETPPPDHSGRNLARHEAWLRQQTTPVLRLDGSHPTARLCESVMAALRA